MTLEYINELKIKYQKEADYFGNIDFLILQGKFQEFVNFLNEIEEVVKENEVLKARVAEHDRLAQLRAAEARDEADSEVCD